MTTSAQVKPVSDDLVAPVGAAADPVNRHQGAVEDQVRLGLGATHRLGQGGCRCGEQVDRLAEVADRGHPVAEPRRPAGRRCPRCADGPAPVALGLRRTAAARASRSMPGGCAASAPSTSTWAWTAGSWQHRRVRSLRQDGQSWSTAVLPGGSVFVSTADPPTDQSKITWLEKAHCLVEDQPSGLDICASARHRFRTARCSGRLSYPPG